MTSPRFSNPRDLSLAVALLGAVAGVFWIDQLTPEETPAAVLYALPLFLAGAWLVDWLAALIGAAAVSLYIAEGALQVSLISPYRVVGLVVLILACWWAVRTGRDHARLRLLSGELAAKAAELEKLRVQREAMNSMVAHELRGALSSVSGYSKLLLRNQSRDDAGYGALRAIADGSDRLDRLTQDLLEEANVELGHLILNRQAADVVHLVRENVEFYRELTGRRIALDAPADAVFGNWDELRITQVVRNLLTNALKYSPPEETVEVAVNAGSNDVAVAFRNVASDVSQQDLERVFLPFTRLDTHQRRHGYGLGLHVTRALIERHGGHITATATNGTVEFRFTLPR